VDVLVCECTSREKTPWPHLSWAELRPRLADLGAGIVVLTHRGRTMQDAPPDLPEGVLLAEDDLLLHVKPSVTALSFTPPHPTRSPNHPRSS